MQKCVDRTGTKGIGFIVDNYDYAMRLANENKSVLKAELAGIGTIPKDRVKDILATLSSGGGNDGVFKAREEFDNIINILKATNSNAFYSGETATGYIKNVDEIIKDLEKIKLEVAERQGDYWLTVDKYNTNIKQIQNKLKD